jgi:DNA-binding MarR family transcriptional regulator
MNTENLSSELRNSVSRLYKRLRKQMHSAEVLSMTEIETLGLLYLRGALLPSELASLTKIKMQSMSQILKKMEQHEVIARTPSETDGRKVYIALTATGRTMIEQTRYERDEWLNNVVKQALTDKERKLLREALPVLNKIAEAQ